MARRNYTLTAKCIEPGCNECSHYSYETRREYNEGYKRHANYKCSRHSYPEKVLSIQNLKNTTELVNMKGDLNNGLFWAKDGKLGSGFNFSDAHMAYSKDFPEGTILRITVEVILPKAI